MRRLLPLVLLLLVLPPGAQAASPRVADVVARCNPYTPPDGAFTAEETREIRAVARCALDRARRAASSRNRVRGSRSLDGAARSGLTLAVALRGDTAANRRRVVRRVAARHRCSGREAVRAVVADTTPDGGAATPREVVKTVLRATRGRQGAVLLRRDARFAVRTRTGQVLAGRRKGAVALILAAASCRPR